MLIESYHSLGEYPIAKGMCPIVTLKSARSWEEEYDFIYPKWTLEEPVEVASFIFFHPLT